MKRIYIEDRNHDCAISDDKLRFLNFVYAHGKLEEEGFDLTCEDKKDHFDKRRNINGEECVAVLPSGKEIPALFFYWKTVRVHVHDTWSGTWRQVCVDSHGLVVAKSDTESIEYARKCFNKRVKNL